MRRQGTLWVSCRTGGIHNRCVVIGADLRCGHVCTGIGGEEFCKGDRRHRHIVTIVDGDQLELQVFL